MRVFRKQKAILGPITAVVLLLQALLSAASVHAGPGHASPGAPAVFDAVLGWMAICSQSSGKAASENPAGTPGGDHGLDCALHCAAMMGATGATLPEAPSVDTPLQKALNVAFEAHVASAGNRLSGSLGNRGPPAQA